MRVPTSSAEMLQAHLLSLLPLTGLNLPQVEGNKLIEDGVLCVLLCLAVTLYQDSELSNLAKIDHF